MHYFKVSFYKNFVYSSKLLSPNLISISVHHVNFSISKNSFFRIKIQTFYTFKEVHD